MKNFIYTTLAFLCFTFLGIAQERTSKHPHYKDMMDDMSVNFYTVCDSAEAYFKTIDKDKKGSGYKPFLRWKYLNEQKYFPSGNRMVDHYLPYKEFERIKAETNQKRLATNSLNSTTAWTSLGPDNVGTVTSHWSPGIGRVEYVAVNPADKNQLYFGSRSGGLWRTNNEGATWTHKTDFLPASGVNAIAPNPSNFNEVLINVQSSVNSITFGIYRSTDGGNTFTQTAFNPSNPVLSVAGGLGSTFKVYVIKYHPTIPNLVFIGTSQGIYKSIDGLTTTNWTKQIAGGDVYDIDFHPTNPNIMYIYDGYYSQNKNKILKSIDLGSSYTTYPSTDLANNNNKKLKITVSPQCIDCVFLSSDNGLWKSTDAGETFTLLHDPAGTSVSLYNAMPNVNDLTKFVSGYVDLFRSTDGGVNFNQCSWWCITSGCGGNGSGTVQQNYINSTHYVHADTNYLDNVNGVFYSCSDGFLSKSEDNGVTWVKLNFGTGIRENYSLGVSQSNSNIIINGAQDNGTNIKTENGWFEYLGADGMECLIHPLNYNIMIGSTQNGGRSRTYNLGYNETSIAPPGQSASWVAPLFYDPNNQFTLYSFGTKVHKSTNLGTSWTDLATPITTSGIDRKIEEAAIAEGDSNKIVVTYQNNIKLSTDGGVTFNSILNNLPSNLYISDVTFDPDNDDTILVSYPDVSSAYGQNKVFVSTNSGATWTNHTYNLGYMPIHNVIVAHGIIYAGAEIGVFYKPLNGTTWQVLGTDLPNVSVRELEVNYGSNSLKGATWGRGLWETKLVNRENYPEIVKTEITDLPTLDLPKVNTNQYVTSTINYTGTLANVYVSWAINTPSFNTTDIIQMTQVSGNIWTTTTPLPNQPAGTKIFFKVTAEGSASDVSETYKFMYEIRPNATDYCAASGESSSGNLYITNFNCSNLNKNYASNVAYSYETDTPIILLKNKTYTASGSFNTGWESNDFIIWIDYNNNNEFEATERVFIDNNTFSNSSGSFTIPQTAYEGNIRMRVRLGYWGDYSTACGTTLGVVKDYLVTIKMCDETQTTTYQDDNWSNGEPSIDKIVIFNDDYTSTANLQACKCTVTSGNITINSNHTFTIKDKVEVNGGSLTFENNASLLQIFDTQNSGNIIFKRNSNPMNALDYTYWASPLQNQSLNIISNADKWYKYNQLIGWQQITNPSAEAMTNGRGYIARIPNFGSGTQTQNTIFTGTPVNGNVFLDNFVEKDASGANAFALLGNPYPSAIDLEVFHQENYNVLNVKPTYYFWTHQTPVNAQGQYVATDYASYSVPLGASVLNGNRYVPAGQSFFVEMNNNGRISFKNNQRVAGNNNQFFRTQNIENQPNVATSTNISHKFWLNLIGQTNIAKQLLVAYTSIASNGYDIIDATTFDGQPTLDFYTKADNKKLVIQARSTFTDTDIVSLGYKTTQAGAYQINIDHKDNFWDNQSIFIKDNLLNLIHNLENPYSFTTDAGIYDTRFELLYQNNALENPDVSIENSMIVYTQKQIIYIHSAIENIKKITIFDTKGSLIFQEEKINKKDVEINNLKATHQLLLIKIETKNGFTITQKIIL